MCALQGQENMQIRLATDSDISVWDTYVLKHPEGVAYQMFAWRDAVRKAYGFKAKYLLAENVNGLCGILPLIDFRIPFVGTTFISLPYCDAGGVLADNEGVARMLVDHARSLAARQGAGCQIRSVEQLPYSGINRTDKVRMLLDLPNNAEQMLAGLDAKVRNQVRKPVRDGLTVKLGTQELVDDFYQVFAENMRDLGSPVHSRQWIEAVVAAYGERCRVAVVRTPDNIPVAAGVVLIHPDTMSIPWASSLRRYNRLNPNMLLYWIFLSLAIDSGCRRFDFGRSTPGEGTYRFKEQWGAAPRQLFWYDFAGNGQAAVASSDHDHSADNRSVRQRVAELWSRIPLAGATWAGPRIRKYIPL